MLGRGSGQPAVVRVGPTGGALACQALVAELRTNANVKVLGYVETLAVPPRRASFEGAGRVVPFCFLHEIDASMSHYESRLVARLFPPPTPRTLQRIAWPTRTAGATWT